MGRRTFTEFYCPPPASSMPAPDLRVAGNARMRFAVAKALAHGHMQFYYQPVVRAGSTRFPAYFEMLARICQPDGTVLPAAGFMPLIEAEELGREVDRLALSTALQMLAETPGLRLSINISRHSMGDSDWLAQLASAARSRSGVCGRLILEVSENAAVSDAAQVRDFMDYVRNLGPSFALDDFGAGATGFRHFSAFRFDMVKIDGSFITGISRSPDQQVLVECLVKLATHFEMMSTAERVEDPADAEWLRAAGIDCLQGYLYGRPSPEAMMGPVDTARRMIG